MNNALKVLFVEDDLPVRHSVTQSLELAGLTVIACESAEQAIPFISPGFPGILVSDVRLPGMDGMQLLRRTVSIDPKIPVILVTGHGDISMAVQAMTEGAYDFVEKPFSAERLVESASRGLEKRSLQIEVELLRRQLKNKKDLESALIGKSELMTELRAKIASIANTSADVLLFGETGTGKELVARCLHNQSMREGNFVGINCGGLPETLFESEIFGHEPGAFTSAGKKRIGKIEHADRGTLMLDEIESMPLAYQIKLLRALQERKIERLGSNVEIPVDFRIVAATKYDLKALSRQGKFREDLYYRLSVAVLELPPLRERREDIPELFEHFILQAAARYNRPVPEVSGDQMRELILHDWPGNVRELRNAADRAVLCLNTVASTAGVAAASRTLNNQLDAVEKALIEQALAECEGRPQAASDILGIAKKTLYDKLHKHSIVIGNYRGARGDKSDGAEPTAD